MPLRAISVSSSAAFHDVHHRHHSHRVINSFHSSGTQRRSAQYLSFDVYLNCVLSSDRVTSYKLSEHTIRSACPIAPSCGLRASGGAARLTLRNAELGVQARFPSSFLNDKVGKDSINDVITSSYGGAHRVGNGESHSVLDYFLGETICYRPKARKGLPIRCSLTVPVPNEHSSVDTPTKMECTEICKNSSPVNEPRTSARVPVKAAFFDVDGTITRTNVVLAYLCVRLTEISFLKKLVWLPWFALICLVYLVVDYFHRPTFNRIFYMNYKDRPADSKNAMANLIYERYYKPRIMAGAIQQIQELKQLGYRIIFVTGALDFQIAPLARDLGADYVYAAKLVEKNGRFTGEMNGMATSNSEKAERVWDYAKRFGVSLSDSLAFGDSIADIAMLEIVGRPHAVNPDARLRAIALNRGWAILNWYRRTQNTTAAVPG